MLHKWMIEQKNEGDNPLSFNAGAISNLSIYSMFPAYPTAFVLAADVVLEVSLAHPCSCRRQSPASRS